MVRIHKPIEVRQPLYVCSNESVKQTAAFVAIARCGEGDDTHDFADKKIRANAPEWY
jgi:hypothetical protein